MSRQSPAGSGSVGRRVLLVAGSALIVSVLLVAAFSLGVYVGEVRSGQRPSLLTVLNGPAQPGTEAKAPALDFPEGRPTLLGTVQSAMPGALIVRTQAGARTLSLDDQTRLRHYGGRPAQTGDLAAGVRVAVFGEWEPASRQLRASAIVILPAATPTVR